MIDSTPAAWLLLNYCTLQAPPTLKQKKEAKNSFRMLHPESENIDQAFHETTKKITAYLNVLFSAYAESAVNELQLATIGGQGKRDLIAAKGLLQRKIQTVRNDLIDLVIPPLKEECLGEEKKYREDEVFDIEKRKEQRQAEDDSIVNWLVEKKEEVAASVRSSYSLFKKEQQREFIRTHRQSQDLALLSDEAALALFQECLKEEELICALKKDFELIFSISSSCDHKESERIRLAHSGYAPFCATLTAEDVVMGYSLYKLCHSTGMANIRHYTGQKEFPLNVADLERLHHHLRYMIETIKMFSALLQGVLGGEEGQYFELGKKKIVEAVRDQELFNARKNEKFYVTNEHDRIGIADFGLQAIKAFQEGKEPLYFYLFSQISLKLDDHPQRDALKALFEKWYREEGMKSLNGLNKTFQFDDPYRSVLDPLQISQIAPRMSAHLHALKMLEGSSQASQSLEESLKRSFLQMVAQIDPSLPEQLTANWADVWSKLEKEVEAERLTLCGESLLSTVDLYQAKLYKQFVIKYLKLQSPSLERQYNPSSAEISALYGTEQEAIYGGNQKHKNVRKLFKILKDALGIETQKKASPSPFEIYAHVINDLEKELVTRLNEYNTRPFEGVYGKERIDEAVFCFERYVAMIVYRERSKVSDERIINSLIAAAGVTAQGKRGSDLRHGCGSGLVGRFLILPGFLVSTLEDDLENAICQFKMDCLEAAFIEEEKNNSESSMHVIRKEWIAKEFGLRHPNGPSIKCDRLVAKMVQKCNAATIFQETMELVCSNFFALSKERRSEEEMRGEECYAILQQLKMGMDRTELDQKFRILGDPFKDWDFFRFKFALPHYLIPYLVQKKILVPKEKAKRGQATCVIELTTQGQWSQEADLSQLISGGFGKIAEDLAKVCDPLDAHLSEALKGYESFTAWIGK